MVNLKVGVDKKDVYKQSLNLRVGFAFTFNWVLP